MIHILKRYYVETGWQGGTPNCWEDYSLSYCSHLVLLVMTPAPKTNTKPKTRLLPSWNFCYQLLYLPLVLSKLSLLFQLVLWILDASSPGHSSLADLLFIHDLFFFFFLFN